MERAIESGPQAIRLRKQRLMILVAILVVTSVPFILLSWQNPRDSEHPRVGSRSRPTETRDPT